MKASSPRHPNIQAALAAAAGDVQSPQKDGHNAYHDYAYTTAEAMIGATKKPLADHGLTVRLGDLTLGDKSGDAVGSTWLITAVFIVEWEGGQSAPSSVTFPAMRDKGRPWDKAINAALTNVTSYWLRGLLNIPRGMGPSVDERVDKAEPEAPLELLRSALKERVGTTRAEVNDVIALCSESSDGVPQYADWRSVSTAADPDTAADIVLKGISDFLTSLAPVELITRAKTRAKERAAT